MGAVGGTERDEVDRVLERLLGLSASALVAVRVEPLVGWTNRNYKVSTGAATYALRIPRPGTGAYIDRDAERHNARCATALGVNADVIVAEAGGIMLTEFVVGAPMDADRFRDDPGAVQRAGRALALVHHHAGRFRGRFDAMAVIERHRSALGPQRPVPALLDQLVDELRVRGHGDHGVVLVPSHNDTWPCNFIDTGGGMRLLDWEYSAMNDPAWDLANFSVEAGLDDRGDEVLLAAYTEREPTPRLLARVTAAKALTDVVWAAWALVQDADGNPAQDFPAYAEFRLERARRALR